MKFAVGLFLVFNFLCGGDGWQGQALQLRSAFGNSAKSRAGHDRADDLIATTAGAFYLPDQLPFGFKFQPYRSSFERNLTGNNKLLPKNFLKLTFERGEEGPWRQILRIYQMTIGKDRGEERQKMVDDFLVLQGRKNKMVWLLLGKTESGVEVYSSKKQRLAYLTIDNTLIIFEEIPGQSLGEALEKDQLFKIVGSLARKF